MTLRRRRSSHAQRGAAPLDTLVQLAVLDRDLTAPPGSPAEGAALDREGRRPTGAWTGHADHIAAWQDGELAVQRPATGWSPM